MNLPVSIVKVKDIPRQVSPAEAEVLGAAGATVAVGTAAVGVIQVTMAIILQASLS